MMIWNLKGKTNRTSNITMWSTKATSFQSAQYADLEKNARLQDGKLEMIECECCEVRTDPAVRFYLKWNPNHDKVNEYRSRIVCECICHRENEGLP